MTNRTDQPDQQPSPQPCINCNGSGTVTITGFDAGVTINRSETCSSCAGSGRSYS